MNKGYWKILEAALNVLDNLVFVDRAKYEAPKEKRKPGRPAKARETPKRKVRNLHDYFKGKWLRSTAAEGPRWPEY
jgi:hypothetical protein